MAGQRLAPVVPLVGRSTGPRQHGRDKGSPLGDEHVTSPRRPAEEVADDTRPAVSWGPVARRAPIDVGTVRTVIPVLPPHSGLETGFAGWGAARWASADVVALTALR
jgi:hypothetical protein